VKHSILFLTILLLFGFFIRAAALGHTPPALNSDELLKVFDGASVYHTGRDHHGEPYPLFFKQSGEYSPPLYIYFAGLFSAPFGISPCTTRLPSAVLGTLSILFLFLYLRELVDEKFALIASALVTVSPWHLFYSRMGWEAISLVPFLLAGLWLFTLWTKREKLRHLLLSCFCFALTIYTYPAARLFVPLLLLGLFVFHFHFIKNHLMHSLAGFILMLLIALPYLWIMQQNYAEMQARWQFVSVFNADNGWLMFIQHYLQHLSPVFLFFTGDYNPRHMMMGGVALLVLLPFFGIGFIDLVNRRDRHTAVFLLWFFIFAIPSSLTYDRYDIHSMPNALRSTCGIPVIEIISTCGILRFLEWIRIQRKKVAAWGIAAAVFINAAIVLYDYFVFYPHYAAPDFQYGLREIVQFLQANQEQYDKIIVSPNVRLHPVALAAFSGIQPRPFTARDFPGYIIPFYNYVPVYHDFGMNEFQRYGNIARWYSLSEGRHLIVARDNEITVGEPLKQFFYPDGSISYEIYENLNKN
jgi:4-amino-4-deoxy-L-arabinose transferase-like glycosyltransferase